MGRLERGEFGRRIQRLLDAGVDIRCGNCGRLLNTPFGPRYHLVYDDGSGRCFAADGIFVWSDELTPGNSTRTRFAAALNWAEQQVLSHGETGSIEREDNS